MLRPRILGLCARSSIADRKAPGSPARRHPDSRVEGDGLRQRGIRRRCARRLPGSIAVGHVRCPAGESRLANAQPIVVDSVRPAGRCAQRQSGERRRSARRARSRSAIFQTNSDTKSSSASSREKAEGSRSRHHRGHFAGSRRSLVMMTKDRLIGRRCAWVSASRARPARQRLGRLLETCAMDLIGATYVRDVEPKSSSPVRMASGPSSPIRLRDSRNASSSIYFAPGQLCVR